MTILQYKTPNMPRQARDERKHRETLKEERWDGSAVQGSHRYPIGT
jgi:hypothetical protein